MTTFDQADIRAEAEAFVAFMEGAVAGYGLQVAQMIYLGYSNGANLAAAVMALHPGTIGRTILLRCMPVLDPLPAADLTGANVLMLSGNSDPYSPAAAALEQWFRKHGARIEHRILPSGHELDSPDVEIAREWLHAAERDEDG